jgi:hypothetical protein
MEFILYYRGPLKSNGTALDKHHLREYFNFQLSELWNQAPLLYFKKEALDPNPIVPGLKIPDENLREFPQMIIFPSIIKKEQGISFVPLINKKLFMVAELDITLLRPEVPGNIITQGGDIDNRIKTLLDALKIPDKNQISAIKSKISVPDPFFCLLEDDALVTKLTVSTNRLLEPNLNKSEVILMIQVTTKKIIETIHNISLG